ncbi:Dosage compensation protein dpy-30 [Caenorhabditis elegans]|uniref:Dosage compensation protein dpy-30 n=1 Tax=Caenorhabditis elegans TaxID=6239 RepID=DPY30_CAEEL|nr:Dosage compensation protein dpy-30 [Caenorhabditis elegans]Q10661.1 RecName: Full=Dosage compensation protein dpy-30; AltName: Full=Protein dumpy-30 [Caenorhabditis elegans]AAA92286.1 nuclear protein essential for dosage compensation [Caenorhabditis elegans]CAB01452.1 Dosage compensation protein dpy-30 [Caenorhabditis elegans]|eukprot:NP_506058.1 Dosage compensation protein dpy-30 [Caenorhabditis elegans]
MADQTASAEVATEKMDTAEAPAAAPAASAAAPAEAESNENTTVPSNVLSANGGQQTGNQSAPRNTSTVPTRQYLDSTVVPILLQGLGALAKDRPENPIEFLANFLLREKDRYNAENQNPAGQQ